MKKTLCIFLLLVSFGCLSQISNGKVQYGVHITTFEGLEKTTRMKAAYLKAMENAAFLNFELIFDTKESCFLLKEGLGLDDQGYGYAKLFSGYQGKVYQDAFFSYTETTSEIGNYLVKKDKSIEWSLENVTKEINGFVCYKANAVKTVVNSVGVFRFPIIAWYCPQIPLSYGPNGYGGLPGLILELQVRNILFGVKKIDLKPTEASVPPKQKSYQMISEKEFENLFKK
ncbi:GLPGLI family protein [Flavobacterium sp. RSSA_27]|uniref:GLPGLI family protein n=1 Tax=Flavobacterium sp. RSSA_27 TaxID=3447667 RepID=UPI003F39FE1F